MRVGKISRPMVMLCACVLFQISFLEAGDRKSDYLDLRRLIGKEKFHEAIERCKELIEIYPDYFYLYETLAEVSAYARDLDNAQKYFEERIEEGREIGLAYYALGRVYDYKKDYRTAVLAFDKAIELGVDVPECYRDYEYAYEKLEGLDSAVRYFSALCHRDPQNANFRYALALAYWSKQDFGKVLQQVDEALSRRKGEPKFLEARAVALFWEGRVADTRGSVQELLRLAQERADLAGVQFLRMHALYVYNQPDAPDLNNSIIQEAIRESREFGQFRWLGWGLHRLAGIEYAAGEFENALLYANQGLEGSALAGDYDGIMMALTYQFAAYMELGDYEDALERAYFRLRQAEIAHNEYQFVKALEDLAWTHHEVGDDVAAFEYAIEALAKAEASKLDKRALHEIHTTLGLIYEGIGQYSLALDHYNLAYQQISEKGVYRDEERATTHGNLGNAYLQISEFDKSEFHFQKQLLLARSAGFFREEAYALAYLGNFFLKTGELRLSHRYYEQGLELGEKFRLAPLIVLCQRGLGKIAEASGRLDKALTWYQRAIVTDEVSGHQFRLSLSDSRTQKKNESDYYRCIRLLCLLGKDEEAFEAAEDAKLRTGLNSVTVSQRKILELLSDSYRARVLRIKSELERKHAKLAQESKRASPEKKGDTELTILSEITGLEIEYRKILDSAKVHDPRYYGLLNPRSMPLKRIQQEILVPDQALLEYVVGDEQTQAFLLKPHTLLHFTITTGRSELSDLLARVSYSFRQESKEETAWNAALANFDAAACSELYKILIKPLEEDLQDANRLIIVPDDLLKNLPFEALIPELRVGQDPRDFSQVAFLVEKFEVSYAPAVSLLDSGLQTVRQPRKLMLAVGNPKLGDDDYNSLHQSEPLLRASTRARFARPLPGAEKEVTLIGAVFRPRADLLLGKRASKVLFKELAPQYKILHIAAHADIDSFRPLNSSIFLVGDPQANVDGILRAFEFFNLELNADLAVLSACNTGRSKGAEGLEGLVRGLVFAGVPSVVATLWTVDDESTAILMEHFYRYLKKGERKSRALQLAKIDLIKSGKADPFYWAGFVLIGDPSPIDFSEFETPASWTCTVILSLVVGLIEVIAYRSVVRN